MKSLPHNYGNLWNLISRKDTVMTMLLIVPMSNVMTSSDVESVYGLRSSGMVCQWRSEERSVIEFISRKGMVDFLVDPSKG